MPGGAEDLGRSVLRLVTDASGIQRGIATARSEALSSLNSVQSTLDRAGSQITKAGSSITTGITLPVAAAGAAIVKVGTDFEATLNQIVGLTDVSREEIGGIKKEILAMGVEIGRTPQELAEGLYFLASAGFNTKESLQVLRVAATAAAAGLGTTQAVAKVLGLTINAYGHENITAAHAADILTAAVKDGTAEADAFAGVLGRVVPTAATLGVSFDQVAGALAGMTLTGLSADEAATSLNQVLVSLLKPTSEAEKTLKELGFSAAELRQELKEKGLLAVLRDLETAFNGNDDAAAKVFGNVRALRGVLSLLAIDSSQLDKVFADTAKAQGDLADGYRETEGSARQFGRAQAQLESDLINLSTDVLPVVIDLLLRVVAGVHGAVQAFKDLPPEVRSLAVAGLALLAALGPVLFVTGSLISSGAALLGVVTPLAAAIAGLLVGAIEALATVLFATGIPALERLALALLGVEAAAAPVVIVIAAIGAALLLAQAQADEGTRKLIEDVGRLSMAGKLTSEAWDEAVTAYQAFNGRSPEAAAKLRALTDAWIVQQKSIEATAGAVDLGVRQMVAASERTDAIAGNLGDLKPAYEDAAAVAKKYAADVKTNLDKAFSNQATYTSKALKDLINFRAGIEQAFAAAQDALTDSAETAAKIAIKEGELADADAGLTKALKGGTKAQIAEWRLRKIEALKELNELKVHAALIGADMDREQKLQALLTSKDTKDGLTSKHAEVKAAYTSLRDTTLLSLWQLAQGSGPAAKAAAASLQAYLDPSNKNSPLHDAPSWGGHTGAEWASMLAAAIAGSVAPGGVVKRALETVGYHLRASSPPGPLSPLHEIDKWGWRTGESWVAPFIERLASAGDRIGAPLARIGASLSTSFTPPRLALAAAGVGAGIPAGAAARPGPGGGRGVTVLIEHIDASGHDNPAAVGEAVRQGVGDAIATVFRDQDARGTTGVEP